MNLGLKGKNAIITGGSKGIGRGIALTLAQEGANVAICARGEEALRQTEKELRATGVNVYAATCDVGKFDQLDAFIESASKNLGGIDILVNNVSALSLGNDLNDWEASLSVDLMASVRGARKVIPEMIENGGGSIIFISSTSALEAGSPPPYAAAKAAIVSYSKTIAIELASKNIRVNTIAPGSIEFEGGVWAYTKNANPDFYNMVLSTIPSGRMGTPEEVGKLTAFIASPCASWVTGTCIAVDGGQHKSNL